MPRHSATNQKSSRIVELVGLAGVGKTTIARALSQTGRNFRVVEDLELRKLKHIPVFLTATLSSLPLLASRCRAGRWFTWDEIKAMAYLRGWPHLLRQQASRNGINLLLDHGPVFKLATLDAFGPERLKKERFAGWWEASLHKWAFTLDMVIWLDAPDPVLLERILRRNQRHVIKGKPEGEAHAFLGRYRTSYEEILGKLTAYKEPVVLRFDTTRASVEQIVNDVIRRTS